MVPRTAFVYILASRARGTLYVGVTTDLDRRMREHRSGAVPGFTAQYGVHRLVWFKTGEDISAAIVLEKKIKNCGRQWKIDLVERENPEWRDLFDGG